MERYLCDNGTMRKQVWCWVCELCGHTWIASGIDAPEQCAKCKRRGWHTKAVHVADEPRHSPLPQAEPIPAGHKPTMADLRSICAGNVPKQSIPDSEPVEDCTPECCECGHKLTGKVVKGVVVAWACTEPGCPMYGLERGDD